MLYFILGMLTISAFMPLIDGILSVIMTGLEAIKGYFGLKVSEYNTKMRKIATEEEDKMKPIGFVYEEEENNE